MLQYKLLVLTDHATQNSENSIFRLLAALRQHPSCATLDVASRSMPGNAPFFHEHRGSELWVTTVGEHFRYEDNGKAYARGLHRAHLH
ncbi:MAG: hypothetical protein KDC54_19415, partial [Lewinella sp.]|nr:hypothetical protein [Lewinella sp.]